MIDRRIYDQACDWIVRLESEAVTAGERSAFVRWLNRREEHAEAYQEMSRLWARMDALGLAKPEPFPDPVDTGPAIGNRSPWFLGYRGAVAASLAVIGLIAATVMFTDPVRAPDDVRHFVTSIKEGHTFTAPDGSQVQLGERTTATLKFDRSQRNLELAEGIVTVDVVPDPKRPFRVSVGHHIVTAVGTRFRVRRTEQRVDVRVFEGKVRFSPRPGAAELETGDGPPDAGTSHAIDLDGGQALSWRTDAREIIVNATKDAKD